MIEVHRYNPEWPSIFNRIRDYVAPQVEDITVAIEHVGSTSVPGLAAKPIIDVDIIVAKENVGIAIERLARLGYVHEGDLGISEREAFRTPDGQPDQHLYVCVEHSLSLRNHLAVRDFLREHPEDASVYARTKQALAEQFPDDIGAYIAGKSGCLARILLASGLSKVDVDRIYEVNTGGA